MPLETSSQVLPKAAFSSRDHEAGEFFDLWRQSISPICVATPIIDDGRTPAEYDCQFIYAEDFLLAEARTPKQHFLRDARSLRRHDDVDFFLLKYYFRGQNITTCGGTEYVEDGTVSVANLAYQIEGFATASHFISVAVPRALVRQHLPHLETMRGKLFQDGSMSNRLLTGHLLTMRREMENATSNDVPMLTASFIALLDTLTTRPDDRDAQAVRPVLFDTIKSYIRTQLGNPRLDSDHLARRFGTSRATLYRMFREVGGVAAYIQQQRLLACFHGLLNPRNLSRPIFDVAADFGLTNSNYLSTQFRREFGQTPREVRQSVHRAMSRQEGSPHKPPAGRETDVMRKWLIDLAN